MTGQTIALGAALVLISVGVLVVAYGRSALAERRAVRTKVENRDTAAALAGLDEIRNMSDPDWSLPVYVKTEDERWADYMAGRPWTHLGSPVVRREAS